MQVESEQMSARRASLTFEKSLIKATRCRLSYRVLRGPRQAGSALSDAIGPVTVSLGELVDKHCSGSRHAGANGAHKPDYELISLAQF